MSKDNRIADADEHAWAQSEITWFVNNSLCDLDRRRFLSHLGTCEVCQQSLEAETLLLENLPARHAVEYAPHESLHKLHQRLDEAEKKRQFPAPGKWRTWGENLSGQWWTPVALAAQAAAIMLLVGTLVWVTSAPEPRTGYVTVANPPQSQQAHPQLQLVFASDVTSDKIAQILQSVGGRIVNGPSAAGVFEVSLVSTAGATGSGVETAMQKLKSLPELVFVTRKSVALTPDNTGDAQ